MDAHISHRLCTSREVEHSRPCRQGLRHPSAARSSDLAECLEQLGEPRGRWTTCQAVHWLLPALSAAAAATAHQCTPDCAVSGRPADTGGWHYAQRSSGKDQSGLRRRKPLVANACRCSLHATRRPAPPAAAPWQAAALPRASGYGRTWRKCASGTLKCLARPACNPAQGGHHPRLASEQKVPQQSSLSVPSYS